MTKFDDKSSAVDFVAGLDEGSLGRLAEAVVERVQDEKDINKLHRARLALYFSSVPEPTREGRIDG